MGRLKLSKKSPTSGYDENIFYTLIKISETKILLKALGPIQLYIN